MKRLSKLVLGLSALVSVGAAAGDASVFKSGEAVQLAQTQAPLQLTCAISVLGGPPAQFGEYCTPPYASSRYNMIFKISGGSGNQAYVWQAPTPNTCTSATSSCSYSTTARTQDVEGTATVTVTDLGTGVVTPLSVYYFIPITCGTNSSPYYC
jgi:hypothetical protein